MDGDRVMPNTERIKKIEVELKNKPGTLADVTQALAEGSINIQGFACIAQDDTGQACFVTDNPEGASELLTEAGFNPTVTDAVFTAVPNEPGQLAKVSRQLADSGVTIDRSFVATSEAGSLGIGFHVDDPQQAEKILNG